MIFAKHPMRKKAGENWAEGVLTSPRAGDRRSAVPSRPSMTPYCSGIVSDASESKDNCGSNFHPRYFGRPFVYKA